MDPKREDRSYEVIYQQVASGLTRECGLNNSNLSTSSYKFQRLGGKRRIRLLWLAGAPQDRGPCHDGPCHDEANVVPSERHSVEAIPRRPPCARAEYSSKHGMWTLKEYDFDECPAFLALSYSWMTDSGDAAREWPVYLDGGLVMHVSRNLWLALHRLSPCLVTYAVPLWADQICINQEDTGEKTAQLEIMGQIYAAASSTFLWLGEENESMRRIASFRTELESWIQFIESKHKKSGEAADRSSISIEMQIRQRLFGKDTKQTKIETSEENETAHVAQGSKSKHQTQVEQQIGDLRRASLQYRSYGASATDEVARLAQEIHGRDKKLIGPDSQSRWDFVWLLNRPWFRRLWILQEVVLSKKLIFLCGSHALSWEQFCRYLTLLSAYDEHGILTTLGRHAFSEFTKAREAFHTGGKIAALPLLFGPARLLKCSDARDRLYALAGISDILTHHPKDYSLSFDDVYLTFAKEIIRATQSLQILSGVQQFSQSARIPSWVPDWRLDLDFPSLDDPQKDKFAASKSRVHIFEESDEPTTLIVRGGVIDVVEYVHQHAFEELHELHAELQELLPLSAFAVVLKEKLDRTEGEISMPDEQVLIAIMTMITRTLGLDGLCRGEGRSSPPFQEQTLHSCVLAWLDYPPLEDIGDAASVLLREQRAYILENMRRMALCCLHRRFMVPMKHFAGLAPKEAIPGDLICILHGSNVPCVLRPVEDNRCRYIGQCYVDNAMYGDACHWGEHEARKFLLIK